MVTASDGGRSASGLERVEGEWRARRLRAALLLVAAKLDAGLKGQIAYGATDAEREVGRALERPVSAAGSRASSL